jgi:hypothetical protein
MKDFYQKKLILVIKIEPKPEIIKILEVVAYFLLKKLNLGPLFDEK